MLKKLRDFLSWKKYRKTLSPQFIQIDSEDYCFRTVKTADISALMKIMQDIYGNPPAWDYLTFYSEIESWGNHLYLLVENSVNKIVGFVGCRVTNHDTHITNIAVLNAYQGKGIGSRLLNFVEHHAYLCNCLTISLEVRASNLKARGIYEHNGYQVIDIQTSYYSDNETALYMVKELIRDDAAN